MAFCIGIGCVYIAYEFNSKSNNSLRGSIYGTAWTINSSDYISDYHQVNINKILTSIDYMASNYKDDSEVSILNKNADQFDNVGKIFIKKHPASRDNYRFSSKKIFL